VRRAVLVLLLAVLAVPALAPAASAAPTTETYRSGPIGLHSVSMTGTIKVAKRRAR
jgi:photosystem II stability/assembly factor-like uncharacterized protein